MARVLDLGNTLTEYNKSLSPDEADVLALRADFRAVGRDMRAAIETVAQQPDVEQATRRHARRTHGRRHPQPA